MKQHYVCTYDDHALPTWATKPWATDAEARKAAESALCDVPLDHSDEDLPGCVAWEENCLQIDGLTEVWIEER